MNRKKELIKRLEIRKEQLEAEPLNLKYKIHNGHHLRDIITILAYLKNEKTETLDVLIRSLPTEEDAPQKPTP